MFNLLQNKDQKSKKNDESWQETEYSWNTSGDSESSETSKQGTNEHTGRKSRRLSLNLSLLRQKDEPEKLNAEEKHEKLLRKSKKEKKEPKSDSDSCDGSLVKDNPKRSESKISDLSKKITSKIHKIDHKEETESPDHDSAEKSPKVTSTESVGINSKPNELHASPSFVVSSRDETAENTLNNSTGNLKGKEPSPRKSISRTDHDKLSTIDNGTKDKQSPRRSPREGKGSPREDLSPKSGPLLRHSSSRHNRRKSSQISSLDISILKEDLLADEDNIARALASLSSLEIEDSDPNTKKTQDQQSEDKIPKKTHNMKSPRRSGERIRRSEDRPRNKSDESSSKENEESPRKREKERDKSPRTNEKDIEKSPRRIAEESEKSHKKKLGHSKSPRKVQEKHRKSERYIKRERDESQAKRLNNENEEIISFGESSTTSEYHTETTETSEEVSVEENNRPNDGHPKPVSRKQQPEDPQDCAALCVLF